MSDAKHSTNIPTTAKAYYMWLAVVHIAAGTWALDTYKGHSGIQVAQSCCTSETRLTANGRKVLEVFTPEEAESLRIASLPTEIRTVWSGYDGQVQRKKGK